MKKLCVFVIMLLLMPGIIIHATPPLPEQEIVIYLIDQQGTITSSDRATGHLDVLVLKVDAANRLLNTVSPQFTEMYGDSNSYDYLSIDNEWISYAAYVSDAAYVKDNMNVYRFFTLHENEYQEFTRFKLIYINENKQIQSISSEIIIGEVSNKQMIDGYILYHVDTGEWENHITVRDYPNYSRFFLLLGLYFAAVILVRTYLYYLISIAVIFVVSIIIIKYMKRRRMTM